MYVVCNRHYNSKFCYMAIVRCITVLHWKDILHNTDKANAADLFK